MLSVLRYFRFPQGLQTVLRKVHQNFRLTMFLLTCLEGPQQVESVQGLSVLGQSSTQSSVGAG